MEGEEKIIGVGNGNITSHEPNKVSYRKAYSGLCAVIVQTTTQPGDFSVVATSPGLVSGKISLTSVAPKPVSIVLDAKPIKLSMDSGEAVVTAEIRDRFGGIVNTATNSVSFKLDGAATFENGLKEMIVQAVSGKAVVNIKALDKEGKATIIAFSEALIPGRVQIRIVQ